MQPNPQKTVDLVFTEEIFDGKLHFFAVYTQECLKNVL